MVGREIPSLLDGVVGRIESELGFHVSDPRQAIQILENILTSSRVEKIDRVLKNRTQQIVTVLENIYDRGNVAAVMRSLESHGFHSLHLIEVSERFKRSNRVSKGAEKWMITDRWRSTDSCIERLQAEGYKVYATHLDTNIEMDDLDWTKPSAIVFGNEKEGISETMKAKADAIFKIPMYGLTQSFNISVAAALTSSFVFRERRLRGVLATNQELESNETWLRLLYYCRTLDSAEAVLKSHGLIEER